MKNKSAAWIMIAGLLMGTAFSQSCNINKNDFRAIMPAPVEIKTQKDKDFNNNAKNLER